MAFNPDNMAYADQSAPSRHQAEITPSDTEELIPPPRWIRVGVGGNVAAQGELSDTSVVHVNVPTGDSLYIRVRKVLATGTTATNIVGYW